MKNIWSVVHDCDDESEKPTCWSREINSPKYGRFVWINENEDGRFEVTANDGTLKTCESFTSAKRWVAMNII